MSSGLAGHIRVKKCLNYIGQFYNVSMRRFCASTTGKSKDNEAQDNNFECSKNQDQDSNIDTSTLIHDDKPRWDSAERDARFSHLRSLVSGPGNPDTMMYFPYSDYSFRYPIFHSPHDPKIPSQEGSSLQKDWTKSVAEAFKRPIVEFPDSTDILIIGGGIMGLSIAYHLKLYMNQTNITVVDRDFTYTHAASNLSLGCIRQQFSNPTNIKMAARGAFFYRNVKDHLSIVDKEPPDINFHPQGYMFLVEPGRAEDFLRYHETQTECGAYVDILPPSELKRRFPWLNAEGIVFATLGLQDEGWIDPFPLLTSFKGKAEFLGVDFVEGEVFDFNTSLAFASSIYRDELGKPAERCNHALIRLPSNEIAQMTFSRCIVCCGAESRLLAETLGIGLEPGLRRIPLPVIPRKRYVFVFNAPDAPVLGFPVLVDPSGVVCRRDGLGGNFIVTKYPTKEEEPDPGNLDVDYSYFEKVIYPILSKRVKGFQKVKMVAAWAGYCDENVFDNNPIIGSHPFFNNIIWCCGFGSHGIQMAPAVGRAMADYQMRGFYQEELGYNLFAYAWERLFEGEKVHEELIL